jgi:hypothetical protein
MGKVGKKEGQPKMHERHRWRDTDRKDGTQQRQHSIHVHRSWWRANTGECAAQCCVAGKSHVMPDACSYRRVPPTSEKSAARENRWR